MRRSEKRALKTATISVAVFAAMGVYTLHGPILHTPIVLTVPDVVMPVLCGDSNGCYRKSSPDIVIVRESAPSATLPHEMLHWEHPDWTECEVSEHLFETTGLKDGYHRMGVC